MWVWDFGLRVSDFHLGFLVSDFKCRILGSGFGVSGFEFRDPGFWSGILGLVVGVWGSGFGQGSRDEGIRFGVEGVGVEDLMFRAQSFGLRAESFGLRVLGFRVWVFQICDSGFRI